MLRALASAAVRRSSAPSRALGATPGRKFPLQPHSKVRAKANAHTVRTGRGVFFTLNDPRATAKFLRHAERVARELGVVDDIAAFDAAASAFPNPPPIVVATCVGGEALRRCACARARARKQPPLPRAPRRARSSALPARPHPAPDSPSSAGCSSGQT